MCHRLNVLKQASQVQENGISTLKLDSKLSNKEVYSQINYFC